MASLRANLGNFDVKEQDLWLPFVIGRPNLAIIHHEKTSSTLMMSRR